MKTFVVYLCLLFVTFSLARSLENDKCVIQQNLVQNMSTSSFIQMSSFDTQSKHSIIITWAGSNSKVLILASVPSFITAYSLSPGSELYRSTNNGLNFSKITNTVSTNRKLVIRKTNGLQRNSVNTSFIYVVADDPTNPRGTLLWISKDRGVTFKKVSLSFYMAGGISFHFKNDNYLLADDANDKTLWGSQDAGFTWRKLKDKVFKYSWSSALETDQVIYVSQDTAFSPTQSLFSRLLKIQISTARPTNKVLLKSTNFGKTWKQLETQIYSFSLKQNFLFISKSDLNSVSRHLKVSTDFGKTFQHVQLPSVTPDRFFSILDMSEGLVFIHVDSVGQGGRGVVYTSDSKGQYFSKSLKNHLYAELTSITDFYKVESMQGTFISTVMHEDKSMHSVITFNRGATWKKLREPKGGVCKPQDKKAGKPCHLQIANRYSMVRGVHTQLPVSAANAVGLFFVHGHVAASLQNTEPDVFVSSNGGYDWHLSLKGSHHLQIADHGGLIVAVPYVNYPKVVKFSTDEGKCWHHFNFTTEDFVLTGLLTEPGYKTTTVAIWGFGAHDKKWKIFVLNFDKVVPRVCDSSDYVTWLSNSEEKDEGGDKKRGCVFGVRMQYRRLKPDSWCRNGYSYDPMLNRTVTACECTKEDYECEFGYSRPIDIMECKRDDSIKELNVCDNGNVKKIISDGYRKLPGNNCTGGFVPAKKTRYELQKAQHCNEHVHDAADKAVDDQRITFFKTANEKKKQSEDSFRSKVFGIFIPVSLTVVIAIGIVIAIVLMARMRSRRRKQLAYHYSRVSSQGRQLDRNSESCPRARDDLLNPEIPHPVYNGRTANGRGLRYSGSDKDMLVTDECYRGDGEDDDVAILQ